MTDQPRILKKVEELSDRIATFVALCGPIKMENPNNNSVIFYPDFRVEPGNNRLIPCNCFYGGENVKCYYKDATIIEGLEETNSHHEQLHDTCIIRQYAKIFLKGKKIAEKQK